MIGKIISEVRQARGMSKSELASKSGISEAHIGYIERGTRNPSKEIALSISNALGIPSETLGKFASGRAIRDENVRRLINAVNSIERAENRLRDILSNHDSNNVQVQ